MNKSMLYIFIFQGINTYITGTIIVMSMCCGMFGGGNGGEGSIACKWRTTYLHNYFWENSINSGSVHLFSLSSGG